MDIYSTDSVTDRDLPSLELWFQGCWIYDMCLSPDSHSLLEACSHGMLKILSVLPILFDNYLSDDVLETRDIDIKINLRSYGCPTCVVWWSARNGNNFGIIGFQKCTIVIVDMNNKEIQKVIELGSEYTPREFQLERKHHNSSTSLFISTTCNIHFWGLLETAEEQKLIGTLINGKYHGYS
ncbi:hypothetical protein LOD99_8648 [Oopsacas minuta]|uniref:F-box associated domain-containing protein n=1 Tax=Oopsacas minuta TaxID=111878 RepID=A0AAV7JFM4_9METZ|nr:hypothetical protein LOD99_8648 [Oopsacas minuta]